MESNNVAEHLDSNHSKKDGLDLLYFTNNDSEGEVLSENVILKFTRNFGTVISKATEENPNDASRRLESLLRVMIHTANCARLSATHRASACNALCGFLELGIASSSLELRTLCFSASTWNQIFDVFIERSEDAKSKPMRQLLVTLVKVLSRNRDTNTVRSVRDAAIKKLLAVILGPERRTFVKPAMQALEHFISKQVIDIPDFLFRVDQVRPTEDDRRYAFREATSTDQSGECQNSYASPLPPSVSQSVGPYPPRLSPWTSASRHFIWSVLDGVRINTDLAPAAGRLLSSFLLSLQRTILKDDQGGKELDVWIRPVYSFMKQHPDLIEIFVNHILCDLLRLGSSASTEFLEILPLHDLERGFTKRLDMVDIQVFLMASKVREELSLMPREYNLAAPASDFSKLYGKSIELLLLHASPSIRLAALTFTTSSKSTTELIAESVLSSLRECIPQFHAEADAKSRNEFISVMKKLLTRLKGGLAQTSKSRLLSQSDLSAEASLKPTEPTGESLDDEIAAVALIKCNVYFLKWYTFFLSGELLPTASYPRHVTAMKLLYILLQLGLLTYTSTRFSNKGVNEESTRGIQAGCNNDQIVRLLLDLFLNPFDDVRSMAVSILKLGVLDWDSLYYKAGAYGPLFQLSNRGSIQTPGDAQLNLIQVRSRAREIMLRTGRADHADGAGRINDLLYFRLDGQERQDHIRRSRMDMVECLLSDLKAGIEIAKENLRLAVSQAPLHGHLLALRYIVSQPYFFRSLTEKADVRYARWREVHDSISTCCAEVWQAVKGVLCVDSPEGHTGEDLEDDDLDIGVKDTLSFSWRALKEASALQHAIITNEFYGPPDSALGLDYNDLQAIGSLAFTQLAELRHRGAFSTVSQAFASCCMSCIKSSNSEIVGLPQEWYQDALLCIHEKASALTRRSAGIPAMVTGILLAHPSSCFFENIMLDLQAISDAPVEATANTEVIHLPQVHAMNCLKDIFTNTQLGPRTEPYIADTLDIAAGCLESDVWAIQNCGLMLLKALLNRLLGKNEASNSTVSAASHNTTTMLYDRFSNLPDLIVKLLQHDTQPIQGMSEPAHKSGSTLDMPQAQKVFPALEIIQRAGVPLKHRSIIKSLLLWHLGSTAWLIRKKTARTLSIITDASRFQAEVIELLQDQWPTQNSLHGMLLCIRETLLGASKTIDYIPSSIVQSLQKLFKPVAIQNRCSFTITAYMDVIVDLLRSQTLATKVNPADKRRLLDLESKLWQKGPGYVQPPIARYEKLLSRDISRYNILTAHHRLDTVGPVNGEKSAAITSLVQELARGDPDVLNALVIDFEDRVYQWRGQEMTAIQISILFLLSILNESCVQDIKAVAMSKLGSLLSSQYPRHDSTKNRSIPRYITGTESFFGWIRHSVHSSPQVADGEIRLQGAILSRSAMTNINSAADTYGSLGCNTNVLEEWTRTLRLAGNECNEPHIRLAAAASLEGFQTALRPGGDRAGTRPDFLGIYLVLYDTLNDDDAEIREKGASIVSWVLSEPDQSSTAVSATVSLSPLAAKSRLSNFLVAHFDKSTALCCEAVGRLAGVSINLGHSMPPLGKETATSARAGRSKMGRRPADLTNIRVSLDEAGREDTTLFVEEKQNLYIDEVQEAHHWATVITKLSSSSIDRDLASELEVWAMQGLAALTEMAEAEVDGPLGWTTKPEVFTLGARIISAAGVIFYWTSLGIASVTAGEVREALGALHRAGEKNCLHGLWMRYIEEILQSGI